MCHHLCETSKNLAVVKKKVNTPQHARDILFWLDLGEILFVNIKHKGESLFIKYVDQVIMP